MVMATNKFMEHYQLYSKYFQDINHIRFITPLADMNAVATQLYTSLLFFRAIYKTPNMQNAH